MVSRSRRPIPTPARPDLRIQGRPVELAIAIALLFTLWVLDALAPVFAAAGRPFIGPSLAGKTDVGDAVFRALVSGVVGLAVCLMIWLGIGWLRYGVLVLAALNALAFGVHAALTRSASPGEIVFVALGIGATVFLFVPRVNAWVSAVR